MLNYQVERMIDAISEKLWIAQSNAEFASAVEKIAISDRISTLNQALSALAAVRDIKA